MCTRYDFFKLWRMFVAVISRLFKLSLWLLSCVIFVIVVVIFVIVVWYLFLWFRFLTYSYSMVFVVRGVFNGRVMFLMVGCDIRNYYVMFVPLIFCFWLSIIVRYLLWLLYSLCGICNCRVIFVIVVWCLLLSSGDSWTISFVDYFGYLLIWRFYYLSI